MIHAFNYKAGGETYLNDEINVTTFESFSLSLKKKKTY